ncbi:MAG: bifunctional phosphoribosylaminoimidazolecarboxamide formyltransferase/IMP cyclohydrolase [Buchnera aphidicola (Nurudea shiraii)]
MKKNITIKNVLISVFDKTGIIEFSKALTQKKINLFTTSGTKKILQDVGIKSTDISEYTKIPEIISGRVKTLHHKIYSGVLARLPHDQDLLNYYKIIKMDLIIVNFYPFLKTLKNKNSNYQDIIESIDIGGPTIVRAAIKNYHHIAVITQIKDYNNVIKEINFKNKISYKTRLKLAYSAFQYILEYDCNIANYFSCLQNAIKHSKHNYFPKYLNITLKKKQNLAYGENIHQKAGLYVNSFKNHNFVQIQGKTLSYNNVSDFNVAVSCVQEFKKPACVIVKHNNPCGVAISKNCYHAYLSAYKSDPISAFGGIIAFNRRLNEKIAETIINQQFAELIIAPKITKSSLKILSKKNNIRILKYFNQNINNNVLNIKSFNNHFLVQTNSYNDIKEKKWKIVSKKIPNIQEMKDALFALKVVKYLKSNAIVYVKNLKVISIGAGQTSRIDAVKIATIKANHNKIDLTQSVVASDAFFPFKDSINVISKQGVSCIIQPGGSIRDQEIISEVNNYNISMIFTQIRYFKH